MCRLYQGGREYLYPLLTSWSVAHREKRERTNRVEFPICKCRIIHCANPETSLAINRAVISAHERLIVFGDFGLVPEAFDVFVFTAIAFCDADAMFTAKEE